MDNFEINIDFLKNFKPAEELTKDKFQGLEHVFSIFNSNGDNKLDATEIDNIFTQVRSSASTNTQDRRAENVSIFDSIEAEHLISNNKDNQGRFYKDLGVTVSQFFEFLRIIVNPPGEGNASSRTKTAPADAPSDEESDIKGDVLGDNNGGTVRAERTVPPELQARVDQIKAKFGDRFNESQCIDLAVLDDNQLELASQILLVERTSPLSAYDLVILVSGGLGKFEIIPENYQRLNELLTLKNSAGAEISSEDIAKLMTLPSDKIDTAIQLLTLDNRKETPLTATEVVNILNIESEELISAVIENPNLKNFVKTRSVSSEWVSVTEENPDRTITYRYVKGQKYPEVVTDQVVDGNMVMRTISNENLNIEQVIYYNKSDFDNMHTGMNPVRMETRHYSATGELEYTEYSEPSDINPGTHDIYTIDSQGNKTYLQQTTVDEQTGVCTTTKRFTDDNGNLTEFSYSAISENEYELNYSITDVSGSEIFSRTQTLKLKQTGENTNTYEYTRDGKTYLLETTESGIVITDQSDGSTYELNYSDFIDAGDTSGIFQQNMLRIPAEILIFITRNPLSLSYGQYADPNLGFCRSDDRRIDLGTITLASPGVERDDAFMTIILHELGHYIDNPDLSQEDADILSRSDAFMRIYREELAEFNSQHTLEEQNIIMQFNGVGYQSESLAGSTQHSALELFAEADMISNTNSKSWTSERSYYLQRYFPRTIAMAQELLTARLSSQ